MSIFLICSITKMDCQRRMVQFYKKKKEKSKCLTSLPRRSLSAKSYFCVCCFLIFVFLYKGISQKYWFVYHFYMRISEDRFILENGSEANGVFPALPRQLIIRNLESGRVARKVLSRVNLPINYHLDSISWVFLSEFIPLSHKV